MMEKTPPEDTIPGERGRPVVAGARSLQSRVSSIMAGSLMVVLGVGLLTWYYTNAVSRLARPRRTAQAGAFRKVQAEMPLPAIDRLTSIEVPSAEPSREVIDSQSPSVPPSAAQPSQLPLTVSPRGWLAAQNQGIPENSGQKSAEELTQARLLAGAAFAHEPGVHVVAAGSDALPATAFTGFDQGSSGTIDSLNGKIKAAASGSSEGVIHPFLRSSPIVSAHARVLPTRRFLLAKGAFIDCTLETAIDSTLPGMTTCITATDTFGEDGTVVLLERGTKLIGETRGQVQQGTARVFVLWTEARTPAGIVVPLDSPGTDALGRSGLQGDVTNHFWARFGAAILISTLDGGVQAAVQSASRGGGPIIYNPSGTESVLTDVLKSSVNIPPTITKPNGDRIQVFVARDVDFRSVYELRPVTAP